MTDFQRIMSAIIQDDIALSFSVFIIIVFAMALLSHFRVSVGKSRIRFGTVDAHAGTIMTTVGVLGTFTGILIGLLDFNVDDINKSVPGLLGGLKIAFTTSIVGMAFAITFRVVQAIWPKSSRTSNASPEQILGTLMEIGKDARDAHEANHRGLQELRSAISGDAEASLVTQIQKLRTDTTDGQKELIKEFKHFADHMVENSSKAVIEALQQVIKDFNQNLTEQFGENFKQLNEAVALLVTWQDKYKEHIETVEQRIGDAVNALDTTKSAIQAVSADCQQIPVSLKPLEPLLTVLQRNLSELEAQLAAVAALKDKALTAFPVVEENLEKLTRTLTERVGAVVENSEKAMKDHQDALRELRESFSSLRTETAEIQETFKAQLGKTIDQLRGDIANALEAHGKAIEGSTSSLQEHISESWQKSEDALNKKFDGFDEQMQQELSRALESMAGKLAALSEKFVADYSPLTDRLKNLVRVAEKASTP